MINFAVMRILSTIILLTVLLSKTIYSVFWQVNFHLNQQEIVRLECENKNRPELHCNGKFIRRKKGGIFQIFGEFKMDGNFLVCLSGKNHHEIGSIYHFAERNVQFQCREFLSFWKRPELFSSALCLNESLFKFV